MSRGLLLVAHRAEIPSCGSPRDLGSFFDVREPPPRCRRRFARSVLGPQPTSAHASLPAPARPALIPPCRPCRNATRRAMSHTQHTLGRARDGHLAACSKTAHLISPHLRGMHSSMCLQSRSNKRNIQKNSVRSQYCHPPFRSLADPKSMNTIMRPSKCMSSDRSGFSRRSGRRVQWAGFTPRVPRAA